MIGLAVLVAVLGVDRLPRGFQVLGIDVAGRHDLGPRLLEEALHIVAALPTSPDTGHRDTVAGGDGAIPPEGGGWHDGRAYGAAQRRAGAFQERSSLHIGRNPPV